MLHDAIHLFLSDEGEVEDDVDEALEKDKEESKDNNEADAGERQDKKDKRKRKRDRHRDQSAKRRRSKEENDKEKVNDPHCEKTRFRGFRPGQTQTELYNYRIWLEA